MDEEQTVKIPRVTETTLEIPRETFLVKTLPMHLLGDPILTMDAPQADDTPLYDQLNPRPRQAKRRPRRKLMMADKVLIGMSAVAIAGITVVYGMVAYGWGTGPLPTDEVVTPHHTVQVSTPSEAPMVRPTSRHTRPPVLEKTVVAVVAPTHYRPRPTHRVTLAPLPTPVRTTEAPSAPETTSAAPTPTQTSPSPSETPSETPTASQSTTPASPSVSLEPQ